jgi:hypothetical protein
LAEEVEAVNDQSNLISFPSGAQKKRDLLLRESVDQPQQMPVSPSPVAGMGPGQTERKQAVHGKDSVIKALSIDRSADGATRVSPQVGVSVHNVNPDGRTRNQAALELIGRIGRKTWRFLLDSGSTGNYISAQVCTTHRLKVERDLHPDQLTMADGSKVMTKGRVQIRFKCGEYQGTVQAKVFPGLQKPVILGIPWLKKENPQIDWTQGSVTIQKGQKWIKLPLVSKRKEPTEELVTMVSAKQMSRILKKPSARAYVGMIRKVTQTVEEREGKKQSELYSSQLQREDIPESVKGILKEFADVFPDELPIGLPPVRKGHEFKIDLEDDVPPVHRPLYKLSPLELTEAKKQIEMMLEHQFIRPSESPYGSPVLFSPKKDGGLRFCIDYRWLNKKTIRNQYPLPLPEELFDRLGGAKVFSKLDLKAGYWQIPVRSGDVQKTAFKTRWGLYEYLVMPFGVTNAPAQFMNMMNDLLGEYLDRFVLVFLDDILIYSADIDQHTEHLRQVLQCLRKNQLFAKASKCEFVQTSIEFLGQQVCGEGMTPTEAKLQAIKEWATPQNVTDIRSFLGFTNYYRRFIRNYSDIAGPLTELTKKDMAWQWGPYQRSAFTAMKEAFCRAPILIFPDPRLQYTICTDASGTGAGGTLLQDQGDGLRPIAFLSRRLKPTEQKYSAYERELAAVAYCLQSWRHYVEGCPGGVVILTDHQTLNRIMDQPVLSRVQNRWMRLGLFQSIHPLIKYHPGKANILADALSRSQRNPEEVEKQETPADDGALFAMHETTHMEMDQEECRTWVTAYEQDPKLRAVLEKLRQGQKIDAYLLLPSGLIGIKKQGQEKIVVPTSLRQKILRECHDVPSVGHVGMRRTLELTDRQFHWHGLRGDVTSYVKSCPTCQQMKSDNRAKAGLLQPLEIPTRKWAQVTTDLVTDLPESDGFTAVAVFVDRYTKMVHFAPCTKEVTAMEYARLFIDHVFRLHGLPEVIISDRDPRFTSKFWRSLFDMLGTDLRFSTAFHPQTDGQSERVIQTLENFLRPFVERDPRRWAQQLSLAEFAANNAISVATGYTPFFLNSGNHPILPTTLISGQGSSRVESVQIMVERMKMALEEAQANLAHAQSRARFQANKSRRDVSFEVGDEVLLATRNLRIDQHLPAKLRRRWVGPFRVTRVISSVAVELDLPPDWKIHSVFHVSNLRKYTRSEEFDRVEQPPPPIVVDDDEEYEVEAILRHKGKGARRLYQVLWKGYPVTEASWEPESHLRNASSLLEDYLRRVAETERKRSRKKRN